MSWMEQINPATTVWRGVEVYAGERIAELTAVCVSTGSSDQEIRRAQAGIAELRVLISVPDRIRLTHQQGRKNTQNKGY